MWWTGKQVVDESRDNEDIVETIKSMQIRWCGHIMRGEENSIV